MEPQEVVEAKELAAKWAAVAETKKRAEEAENLPEGLVQVDTKQDASYYGTWTNPEKRQIFNYCEGDTCLTKCDTLEEYQKAVTDLVDWNKQSGYWLGIDPGTNPAMTAQFVAMGLGEFLHDAEGLPAAEVEAAK